MGGGSNYLNTSKIKWYTTKIISNFIILENIKLSNINNKIITFKRNLTNVDNVNIIYSIVYGRPKSLENRYNKYSNVSITYIVLGKNKIKLKCSYTNFSEDSILNVLIQEGDSIV